MSNPVVEAAKKIKDALFEGFITLDRAERQSSASPSESPPAGGPAPPPPSADGQKPCGCHASQDSAKAASLQKELEARETALKIAQDKLQAIEAERQKSLDAQKQELIQKVSETGLDAKQLEGFTYDQLQVIARMAGVKTDQSLRPAGDASPGGHKPPRVGYFSHDKKEWVT